MYRSGTPINAVIFMVTIAFLLGLPLLKSVVAFQAVVSTPSPPAHPHGLKHTAHITNS
jgi:hypothetical protein